MTLDMTGRVFFVVGAPRSGTTMLMRMLNVHPDIHTRPEPHLMTPLAHLGYDGHATKAPYDPFQSAESIKGLVADLPGGEADWYAAVRALSDGVYGGLLQPTGKRFFLDKTPAYSLILPFLRKVYPDAVYVVITRHPFAIFSSFAQSFFDDDWEAAHRFNPVVERYVPALASFVRDPGVERFHHVRYSDLVKHPERELQAICAAAGMDYDPAMVEYGQKKVEAKGLGDPIGVKADTKPNTKSLSKWAKAVAGDPARRALLEQMLARCSDDDLAVFGVNRDTIWAPLDDIDPHAAVQARKNAKRNDRYAWERRLLKWLRTPSVKHGPIGRALDRFRFYAEVILRD